MVGVKLSTGKIRIELDPSKGEKLHTMGGGHYLPCERCGVVVVVPEYLDSALCGQCQMGAGILPKIIKGKIIDIYA
jgi:hypothetical protein